MLPKLSPHDRKMSSPRQGVQSKARAKILQADHNNLQPTYFTSAQISSFTINRLLKRMFQFMTFFGYTRTPHAHTHTHCKMGYLCTQFRPMKARFDLDNNTIELSYKERHWRSLITLSINDMDDFSCYFLPYSHASGG